MEVMTDVVILHEKLKALEKNDIHQLNFILDEINALDFKNFMTDNEIAQNILMDITQVIPAKNSHLLSKFCGILGSFCVKLKVTLSDKNFAVLTDFLITSVVTCSIWVRADVLFALSSILHNAKLYKTHEILSNHVDSFLHWISDKSNEDLCHAALKCLYGFTMGNRTEQNLDKECIASICYCVLSCLKSYVISTDKNKSCKIILSCLRCLQNVYNLDLPSDQIGEILGLLKALLFCGLPGHDAVAPECLYPSLVSLPFASPTSSEAKNSSKDKLRKKRSRKKTLKMKPAEDNSNKHEDGGNSDCSSSDNKYSSPCANSSQRSVWDKTSMWRTSGSESEFSDVEEANSLKLKATIRQHAYIMLHSVIKASQKKVIFGFWSSFLPETASGSINVNNLNLFTSILRDPSLNVRLSAIAVLTELMRASKQFFALVDGRTLSTAGGSFTTASAILTSMVIELHRCLHLALVAERSSLSLTQILKCYATLIDNIPYKRLNADLLLKLLAHLKPLLSHTDLQVQVACLTVFGSLLHSEQVPDLVLQHLMESVGDRVCAKRTFIDQDETSLPWIVKICTDNMLSDHPVPAAPVLVESLQVLSILVPKHFHIVRSHTELMEQILILSLSSELIPLKLHGAKLLEVIGLGILNDVTKSEVPPTVTTISPVTAFRLWDNILSGPFSNCAMNTEHPSLRSVCCDCLSTLPPVIYDELPVRSQIFIITLLIGLSSDEDYTVRGAAMRCLGIYSLFPNLREDLSFLSDVARLLCIGLTDTVSVVRTKASWAMGNLTDALFLSRDEYRDFLELVSVSFLHSIGMALIEAAKDKDRMQASVVRAIGNLLNFLPSTFLEDSCIQDFIKGAQTVLLSSLSAKIMKVSWNACYALRNLLKNKSLVASKLVDLDLILHSLMKALSCANFKVKINAVLALASLDSRIGYGQLFTVILSQLIKVLLTSEDELNFKEMAYFENLQEVICFCICHFASLAKVEDLSALSNEVMQAAELLLTSMWKFGKKASPDKIETVNDGLLHLEGMKKHVDSEEALLELWHSIVLQAKNSSLELT